MGRERLTAPRGKSRTTAAPTPKPLPVIRDDIQAGPSHVKKKATPKSLPKKTNELVKVLNADVVQAEPIGDGPISNVIIPPGTLTNDRTTIVSIPPSTDVEIKMTSQVANRSIQVIR